MFKIAKKLTVIMLSASIIFSCSGIIAHAEGIKDKKQEYYQEYKRIIREANEKIGSKDYFKEQSMHQFSLLCCTLTISFGIIELKKYNFV